MTNHGHDEALATRNFLTKEDAEGLVNQFAMVFDKDTLQNPQSLFARLDCIDDRAPRTEARIPVPGAGLGIVHDALAGMRSFLGELGGEVGYTPEDIANAVEAVLGTMTLHTDEANASQDGVLVCAGCGHCTGAMKNPSLYGLSDIAVDFLGKKYLPSLAGRGIIADVYPGSHDAKAVMIIHDLEVTLTTSLDGISVYTYHAGWHNRILEMVAERLCTEVFELKELDSRKRFEFIGRFQSVANERLAATVAQLCPRHPKFVVEKQRTGSGYTVRLLS